MVRSIGNSSAVQVYARRCQWLSDAVEGLLVAGYDLDRESILRRLKRIEGQVRGVSHMVQRQEYCIDVLTQVAAISSALRSMSLLLLDDHMRHCVAQACHDGDEQMQEKMEELAKTIERFTHI